MGIGDWEEVLSLSQVTDPQSPLTNKNVYKRIE